MTTIKATFEGKATDLEMVAFWGVKYATSKKIIGNRLYVTWVCENTDYESAIEECMECVDHRYTNYVEMVNFG